MSVTAETIDRLKAQLLTSGLSQRNQSLFQVINTLIDALRGTVTQTDALTGGGGGGGGVLGATILTSGAETATLPNSRQVIAGAGIQFNDSPNGRRVISTALPLVMDGEDGSDGLDGPPGIDGVAGVAGANGAQGVAGSMGLPGLDGEDGEDGFSIIGPQGDKGGVRYTFNDTLVDADPGLGFFSFNSGSFAGTTQINLSVRDFHLVDFDSWIFSFGNSSSPKKGLLALKSNFNYSNHQAIFRLTGAPVFAVFFYRIPVEFLSGNLFNFDNNEPCTIEFSITGDLGATGSPSVISFLGIDGNDGEDGESSLIPGPPGNVGATGAQGIPGPMGIDGEDSEIPYIIPGPQGIQGPAGSSSVVFTEVLVAIGKGRAGTFDVGGLAGLTGNKPVLFFQTASDIPSKGSARDEVECDRIHVAAYVLNTTTIRCLWNCDSWVIGDYKFGYLIGG